MDETNTQLTQTIGGVEVGDHIVILRLFDKTQMEFGDDVTWQLDEESLCLFIDNGNFLLGEFPREAVTGIWRQTYSEEQR